MYTTEEVLRLTMYNHRPYFQGENHNDDDNENVTKQKV